MGKHRQEHWARQACLWKHNKISPSCHLPLFPQDVLTLPDCSAGAPNSQGSQARKLPPPSLLFMLMAVPQHDHSLPSSPADTACLFQPTARKATLFNRFSLHQYSQASVLGTGQACLWHPHRTSAFRHPPHEQLHQTNSLEMSPNQNLLQRASTHGQERWARQACLWQCHKTRPSRHLPSSTITPGVFTTSS